MYIHWKCFSSFGSSFTSNPLAKTTAYVDSNIARASMVSTVLTENEELVLITYSLRDNTYHASEKSLPGPTPTLPQLLNTGLKTF